MDIWHLIIDMLHYWWGAWSSAVTALVEVLGVVGVFWSLGSPLVVYTEARIQKKDHREASRLAKDYFRGNTKPPLITIGCLFVLGLIFIGPYKFNVSKTEATRIEGMQLQNYIRSLKSEKEDAIEAARKLRGTIGEIINKPPDPSLVSVGATFRLVGSLRQTLQSAAPITLLLTYTTTENHKAMTELSALISEACGRNAGRLACTVSESDQPVEQSGGVYPISKRQGITIHLREPKADNPILLNSLYRDLSSWFIVTKDSSSISQVIMSRNNKSRDMAFVWMEIGPGSPWKADDARISHGLERLNRELAQVGPDGTTPQGPPE